MTQDKEAFLDRWSRLKREQPDEPPVASEKNEQPAAPLPPVENLTPESDFRPFMNPKADPAARRDALKKLFADPHYNVADAFEAYSEDYTRSDPIPEKMLKAINRARDLAVKGPEQVAEEERLAEQARLEEESATAARAEPPLPEPKDVAGRQDT